MSIRTFSLAVCFLVAPFCAFAQVPMTGTFVAEARCPVLQSIRQQTNPGGIATEPGRRYRLIGRNASSGTHYYILVEEAEPARRWVAVGCGSVADNSATASDGGRRTRSEHENRSRPSRERYVLAANWHPAFCEARPRSRDCRSGGEDGGFSLHGLWPQPRDREYCGVPAGLVESDREEPWRFLPEPELSAAVRRGLERVMPGMAAHLHRHEWLRHGTCYGADAETYFAHSVAAIDALNASGVDELFAASIGRELSTRDVRAAFDAAFGPGAGERVSVDCVEIDGRRLIGELRIELAGSVSSDPSLGGLMLAAPPVPPGCRGGEVDAAGFG